MKKTTLSITLLAGFLTFAQKTDSTNTKNIDEIIINTYIKKESSSTNKMPLKAIEDPQVYSSIDKDVLQNQLILNVDDAFRNVTGVQRMWSATSRSGDGGTFINMRGFVSGSSMRNGLVAPVSTSMDAINIEKVEVLKGPSATLFGSNATSYGGVVNRVTKKPFDTFGGNIALIGGSNNYYRVQADVNAPLTQDKKLLFRLNSAYTNTGTFQIKDAKNEYYAFTPAITYKPNDKLEINAEFEMFRTNASPETGIFFYFPASTLGFDNFKEAANFGYDYKQSYIGKGLKTVAKVRNLFGQVNYKINDHITSSSNINTSYSYSNGFNPYFYLAPTSATDPTISLVRADQSTENSTSKYFQIQQNFNFDYKFGNMRNRTVAGFDYLQKNDNQLFIFSNFDQVPLQGGNYSNFNATSMATVYNNLRNTPGYDFAANNTYPITGKTNFYSGYISNVFTPISGLNILVAIRYENVDALGGKVGQAIADSYSQSAWSPKFGVVYQIVPNKFSVFGNYQNSFKSNGYYTSNTAGNILLSDPERANQFEGGFKTNLFMGKVNATLSYYDIKVSNTLLGTGQFTSGGQAVQNQAGSLVSKGAELEINAYLLKGFSMIGGVSYNNMKYTEADADVIGRRPTTASSPWLVNLNASYQFLDGNLKGLGFGFGGNYASDNKIMNSVSMGTFILPKYLVLNANAFYDTKKFRIGVKVDNLTNEYYWNGYTTANAQDLRNILGSFTVKF
ncbi:TonB-dependent siderophore receptor [Halpernia sp.]|uniref:TonB-dependent siderophore receptor n=1 Tax=Halpernia sp. TaxID=2782209 RepID=UPI003A8EE940